MAISQRQFVSGVAGAGIASMAAPNLVLAQKSGSYDKTAFLKNPVYSRDYPPARNLEP